MAHVAGTNLQYAFRWYDRMSMAAKGKRIIYVGDGQGDQLQRGPDRFARTRCASLPVLW